MSKRAPSSGERAAKKAVKSVATYAAKRILTDAASGLTTGAISYGIAWYTSKVYNNYASVL